MRKGGKEVGREGREGEEEGGRREGREGGGREEGGEGGRREGLGIRLTLSGFQSMLEMGCDASVTFCSNDTEPITPTSLPASSFFTLLSG